MICNFSLGYTELEKARIEAADWRGRYKAQADELASLNKEVTLLCKEVSSLRETAQLLSTRDVEVRDMRSLIAGLNLQVEQLKAKRISEQQKFNQESEELRTLRLQTVRLLSDNNQLQLTLTARNDLLSASDLELKKSQTIIENLQRKLSSFESQSTVRVERKGHGGKTSEELERALEKALGAWRSERSLRRVLKKQILEIKLELASANKSAGIRWEELVLLRDKIASLSRHIFVTRYSK
jgi:chromosome segregation ATPase